MRCDATDRKRADEIKEEKQIQIPFNSIQFILIVNTNAIHQEPMAIGQSSRCAIWDLCNERKFQSVKASNEALIIESAKAHM